MTKVIVFDLDETIGHFMQISELDWKLKRYFGKDITKKHFFKILDIFPEVFRPNIFNIFRYLHRMKEYNKKNNKEKIKIMIYTNNTGCRMWANRIKSDIEKSINYKLFDRTICAWKVDGQIIEKHRTGYDKKYFDLLRCGHLKKRDKIIFLDDSFFPKMMNPQLTYLHVTPYNFRFNREHMFRRYVNKIDLPFKDKFNISKMYIKNIKNSDECKPNNKSFKIKGKKIEKQIKHFIETSNNRETIKKKYVKKNQTRKKTMKQNYHRI